MAPNAGTMFTASVEQRVVHNHSFRYVHQARRGKTTSMTTLTKDYALLVPPKFTPPIASDIYAAKSTGVPTHQSRPMVVKENFLVHTMAAIAVSLAIIAGLLVLITTGVTLKRVISKRQRRDRQVGKENGKGKADHLMEEGVVGKESPDSPASPLQISPSFTEGHDIDLERGIRGPTQRTTRASWFARTFQNARTGFHRKDAQSPKEASPFLGRHSTTLPQQKTWSNFPPPETLSYPTPPLHHMHHERKGACEIHTNSQVAHSSGLSLHHSLDSIAFASSVHRASQAKHLTNLGTQQGLETDTAAKPSKGGQKDMQEVSIPASVSIESFVGSFAEKRSSSAMNDTSLELVPTISLQIVGTSGTTGCRFEHQENLAGTEQMNETILAPLDLKGTREGDNESLNAKTEQTPGISTVKLLPQAERFVLRE